MNTENSLGISDLFIQLLYSLPNLLKRRLLILTLFAAVLTIKLVDKDTKEVIKELPPEKTLDMIAKVWDMAGISPPCEFVSSECISNSFIGKSDQKINSNKLKTFPKSLPNPADPSEPPCPPG